MILGVNVAPAGASPGMPLYIFSTAARSPLVTVPLGMTAFPRQGMPRFIADNRFAAVSALMPLRACRRFPTVCGRPNVRERGLLVYRGRVIIIQTVLRRRLRVPITPCLEQIGKGGGDAHVGGWRSLSRLGHGCIQRILSFGLYFGIP